MWCGGAGQLAFRGCGWSPVGTLLPPKWGAPQQAQQEEQTDSCQLRNDSHASHPLCQGRDFGGRQSFHGQAATVKCEPWAVLAALAALHSGDMPATPYA